MIRPACLLRRDGRATNIGDAVGGRIAIANRAECLGDGRKAMTESPRPVTGTRRPVGVPAGARAWEPTNGVG
jgi:hypothetical protein